MARASTRWARRGSLGSTPARLGEAEPQLILGHVWKSGHAGKLDALSYY